MVRACGVYTREIISSTLKKNSSKLVTKNIVLSFPYLILLERSVHKMVNPGMYAIADCTYTISSCMNQHVVRRNTNTHIKICAATPTIKI